MIKKIDNGITLISLIITIVVLLILAGISIAMLTGENGIITQAIKAVENMKDAEYKERINMSITEYVITGREKILIEILKEEFETEKNAEIKEVAGRIEINIEDKVYYIEDEKIVEKTHLVVGDVASSNSNIYVDKNGDEIQIPVGFKVKENEINIDGSVNITTEINKGLVIIDNSSNNEFVWVEVPRTNEVYSSTGIGIVEFDNEIFLEIENDLKSYTQYYRNNTGKTDTYQEGVGIDSEQEFLEIKNEVLKNIYQREGFYISRYEIGSNNVRGTGIEDEPLSQKAKYPYTNVTVAEAQKLSEQIISQESGYKGSLLFGFQWDLILKFFQEKEVATADELNNNSKEIGNYSDSQFEVLEGMYSTNSGGSWTDISNEYTKAEGSRIFFTTGTAERNRLMNIYDIGGNAWEWTLENSLVIRGGRFEFAGTYHSASARYSGVNTNTTLQWATFRTMLY